MVGRTQVYRTVWPLITVVLVVAACNNVLACGLCPQKTTRTPSHCAERAESSELQHRVDEEMITTVAEHTDECSHCVTHSPIRTNSMSLAVVAGSSSHDFVAAHWFAGTVKIAPATKPVELHDHGPPGRSSPRYVLNHAFRI
jgi:hypothetical protein